MVAVTARVKGVFKQTDYPGTPDEATKKELAALFQQMTGDANGELGGPAGGFAMVAHNPTLARHLGTVAGYIARDMTWCKRKDMRELAVQVLNLHWKCEFSFQSHMLHAPKEGISAEMQAALPYWRTTNIFDDEQRLVIEYSFAVCEGNVSDELFARVVKQYGEKGAVEFTTAVAWWSFWAMILNATQPKFDFGFGKPSTTK
jgi:alkylhydroperoxidase family enzyme